MKIVICCNLTINKKVFDRSYIISSGSWICSFLCRLNEDKKDELLIFCPNADVDKNQIKIELIGNHRVCYFSKKNEGGDNEKELIDLFSKEIECFNPDIIHIFGTEFPHSLSIFLACKKCNIENKVVLNLQGFVGEIAKHYFDGIPQTLLNYKTLRDYILKTSIKRQKENYERLSVSENELLRSVPNVIGRTQWDYNVSKNKNGNVRYYDCTELIRETFFNFSWDISNVKRHTIFMSQASYPVKGLHFMLPALAEVKKNYPDTTLLIAGPNIFARPFYRDSSYIRYLKKSAKELNLYESIVFLGNLDHESMAKQYINAHVFVVCSQIENESNALSEAMICGTPCVCAMVGGMNSRIINGVNCIGYNKFEIDGLANGIIRIFENDENAVRLSNSSKIYAKGKFDNEKNYQKIRDVYDKIRRENV